MRYGSLEYAYAEPFADQLVADPLFRQWVLSRTPFAERASHARLLSEEMMSARSKASATWWRSHYSEKCRCVGCSGQETDLLAIFEAGDSRFAVHFEFKQPTDRFPTKKDQGLAYAERARCWIDNPPKAVLPHQEASTALVCSTTKLSEYEPHLKKFDTIITFEEIAAVFPSATSASLLVAAPA